MAVKETDENCRKKVIDVALDSGFESVDGFQRAFYREFGCNPGTYSTHPIPVPYFIPTGVKFQNRHFNVCKENEMETRNIFIQVIKKLARKHGFTLLRATASPQNKFKHLFRSLLGCCP